MDGTHHRIMHTHGLTLLSKKLYKSLCSLNKTFSRAEQVGVEEFKILR